MADYGLKITKATKSTTSTNPEDYIFSSKYSTVKVVDSRSGTVTVPASSSALVTLRHDLGFIPVVHLYTEPTPGSGQWRFGVPLYLSDDTYIGADVADTYVDNLYCYFKVYNRTASEKIIKYFAQIFGDSI